MKRVISARSTLSGGGSHSSVGMARHHGSRAAHRDRDPLRDPAARGRVAAGARGGRRRRPVRGQVPRRRPGPEGAGGRDRGRRAGALARAAGARAGARGARPRAGARRAGPGDPGPDPRQRGPEPRRRLPARRAALHAGPPARAGPGGGGRLARRAGREHRPHAAQPQPAALARQPVADRPRRRAVRAPRDRRPAGGRAAARSRRSATTCCWARRVRCRRPTSGWRRWREPAAAAALVPPEWADGAPYAEHLERRLEPPREWMEEAERARA